MNKLRTQRKRLFFDIETAPNVGLFWEAGYKKNIDYTNITRERAIICICYKWEDDEEAQALTWDKKQNDKKMLQTFVKIAAQADELVGHNGNKFDLAWIRTRCLYHGIDMFPKYTVIDTLSIARSKFKFNSNKLDYIGKFLKLGEKIKTSYSLWVDILLGKSQPALDEMINYCKQDVILLEQIYNKIKSHLEPKTHFGVIFKQKRQSCPECGSDDNISHGIRVSSNGLKYRRLQCMTCSKHFRENIREKKG
jgi:DNA polymerase elongation subunit (family B)